jgi:hypothetical protein
LAVGQVDHAAVGRLGVEVDVECSVVERGAHLKRGDRMASDLDVARGWRAAVGEKPPGLPLRVMSSAGLFGW